MLLLLFTVITFSHYVSAKLMPCDRASRLESCYIDCRLANKQFDDMNDTPQINSLGFCHLMDRNIDTSIYNKQPDPTKSPFKTADCFMVKDAHPQPTKAIFVCSKELSTNCYCPNNMDTKQCVSWAENVNSNQNSNVHVEEVKVKEYVPQFTRSSSSGWDLVSNVADTADNEIHSEWIKPGLTDKQRIALLRKAYDVGADQDRMQQFYKRQSIGGLTLVDQFTLYAYTSATKHCTNYRWSLRQDCDHHCRAHWYLFDEAIHDAFTHHHSFYVELRNIKSEKDREAALQKNKMTQQFIPKFVWHGMGGVYMDIFEAMLPESWEYDPEAKSKKLHGLFKYFGPVSTTTKEEIAKKFARNFGLPKIMFRFKPHYDIMNPNYPPMNLDAMPWLIEHNENEVLFFDQSFEILYTMLTLPDATRDIKIEKKTIVKCRRLFAVEQKIVEAKDPAKVELLKKCYILRFAGEKGWKQMEKQSYELIASLGSKARSEGYGSYGDAAPMHSQRTGHRDYPSYHGSFYSDELPQTRIVMFLLLLMVGLCFIGFVFCAICAIVQMFLCYFLHKTKTEKNANDYESAGESNI
eukprot:262531_1